MSVLVKICGITRPEDAALAAAAGADWIGLNFWPMSKRFVGADPGRARALAEAARLANEALAVVGVFVNQAVSEVVRTARDVGLDVVQLHGHESPAACAEVMAAGVRVIKAMALSSMDDVERLHAYPGEAFLMDTPTPGHGGSGRTFDWALARAAVATGKRIFLAGGLDADNVARAVAEVSPHGVDVASGVESAPGIKDARLVRAFVAAARQARPGKEETCP